MECKDKDKDQRERMGRFVTLCRDNEVADAERSLARVVASIGTKLQPPCA